MYSVWGNCFFRASDFKAEKGVQDTAESSGLGSPGDFQKERLKLNFCHAYTLNKLPKGALFFGNSHLPEKTANRMNTGTAGERGGSLRFPTSTVLQASAFSQSLFSSRWSKLTCTLAVLKLTIARQLPA